MLLMSVSDCKPTETTAEQATPILYIMNIRRPAVAGLFYPAEKRTLAAMIESLMAESKPQLEATAALVVPHAGYIYSGPTAAAGYVNLGNSSGKFTRVLLIGPAHRLPVLGCALSSHDGFETPLGVIPVDGEAHQKLASHAHIAIIDAAHREEHSLEVHLPFLQTLLPEITLIPLLVGDAPPELVSDIIEELWDDRTLIVISSDLSHYHDYESARRIDADTARAIVELAPERIGPHDACGCRALNGLLKLAKRKGLRLLQLDLRNSGDTAGPKDSVVGYGAFAVPA
jgi:AmmeMemoRadiSam system protein B